MPSSPAVVDIQLGKVSNFTAGHFWNLQQEQLNLDIIAENAGREKSGIDATVLFRPQCETRSGAVAAWYPRFVAVDFAGAVPAQSNTTGPVADNFSAADIPEVYQNRNQRHPYQKYLEEEFIVENTSSSAPPCVEDLGTTVQSFADFFTPMWNPENNFVPIPSFWQGASKELSSVTARDLIVDGLDGGVWSQLIDSTRKELEHADELQAVQLWCDWKTGFADLGNAIVEFCVDECPKTSILYIGSGKDGFDAMSDDAEQPESRRANVLLLDALNAASVIRSLHGLQRNGVFACLCSDHTEQQLSPFHSTGSFIQAKGRNLFEATALPALGVSLFCTPYILENTPKHRSAFLFDSLFSGNAVKPFGSVKFAAWGQTHQAVSMDPLREHMWDIRFPACISQGPVTYDAGSLFGDSDTHLCKPHWMGRGVRRELSIEAAECVKNRTYISAASFEDGIPLPLAFPQLFPTANGPAPRILSAAMNASAIGDLRRDSLFRQLAARLASPRLFSVAETEKDQILELLHDFNEILVGESTEYEDDIFI